MKKIFKLFIISVIFNVLTLNVFAGSDGTIEINSKSNNQNVEVKDCFETMFRGVFAFNKGLDKIF